MLRLQLATKPKGSFPPGLQSDAWYLLLPPLSECLHNPSLMRERLIFCARPAEMAEKPRQVGICNDAPAAVSHAPARSASTLRPCRRGSDKPGSGQLSEAGAAFRRAVGHSRRATGVPIPTAPYAPTLIPRLY